MWVTLDSRVMGWQRGQRGLNLAFPFPYSFILFLLDRCLLIQALLFVRYRASSWGFSEELYSLVREGQLSMAVELTAPSWLRGESQHFLCSQSGGPGVRGWYRGAAQLCSRVTEASSGDSHSDGGWGRVTRASVVAMAGFLGFSLCCVFWG